MSSVTNLIICINSLDDDPDLKIRQINTYFIKEGITGLVSFGSNRLPKSWYGGTKNLETDLYVGAFNYLELDELTEHIKTIEWNGPTCVQLIYQGPNDFKFSVTDVIHQEMDDLEAPNQQMHQD